MTSPINITSGSWYIEMLSPVPGSPHSVVCSCIGVMPGSVCLLPHEVYRIISGPELLCTFKVERVCRRLCKSTFIVVEDFPFTRLSIGYRIAPNLGQELSWSRRATLPWRFDIYCNHLLWGSAWLPPTANNIEAMVSRSITACLILIPQLYECLAE